jgi:hypothetical protein
MHFDSPGFVLDDLWLHGHAHFRDGPPDPISRRLRLPFDRVGSVRGVIIYEAARPLPDRSMGTNVVLRRDPDAPPNNAVRPHRF